MNLVDQKTGQGRNLEKTLQDALSARADKRDSPRRQGRLAGRHGKVMSIIKRAGASEIAIAAETEERPASNFCFINVDRLSVRQVSGGSIARRRQLLRSC